MVLSLSRQKWKGHVRKTTSNIQLKYFFYVLAVTPDIQTEYAQGSEGYVHNSSMSWGPKILNFQ